MPSLDKFGACLRRYQRSRGGSVAILVAAFMMVIMWCVAFAVDAGSLYFERRAAQGAVDLAAIAAARETDRAEEAVQATLDANGQDDLTFLSVRPGRYSPDPALPPSERFASGTGPTNAVEVRMRRTVPLYFAGSLLGVEGWEVGVSAVAVTTGQAAFSIGSRLARLEGGVLNALLGALLGGEVALTTMDYEALARANVNLFDFMDALATELDLTAASYDDVLATELATGTALDALAGAADAAGEAEAAGLLHDIASAAGDATLPLSQLLDLGPYGSLAPTEAPQTFAPSVNVMDMVSAAATVANGEQQVSANIGAAVPGLVDVRVDLAIGERPQGSAWLTIGSRGAVVRTAQTRLKVAANVGGSGLLSGIAVHIPLYLELAYAQGRLDDLTCGAEPQRDARVHIAARPGIAELWLAETEASALSDFSRLPDFDRARLVHSPVLRATAFSNVTAGSSSDTRLTFDWADIAAHRTKTVASHGAMETLLHSLVVKQQSGSDRAGTEYCPASGAAQRRRQSARGGDAGAQPCG